MSVPAPPVRLTRRDGQCSTQEYAKYTIKNGTFWRILAHRIGSARFRDLLRLIGRRRGFVGFLSRGYGGRGGGDALLAHERHLGDVDDGLLKLLRAEIDRKSVV